MRGPGTRRHGLHLYASDAHFATVVARFAGEGLERGEPAILVPAGSHRDLLLAELRRLGVDVSARLREGRLVLLDADELASRCLSGALPRVDEIWYGFMSLLGRLRSQGSRRFTVWGETPDLLLKAGRLALFRELESLWRTAVDGEGVDLLCSYRGDLLEERTYAGELQAVCGLHTHVLASEDAARVSELLDLAMAALLGSRSTSMMHVLADEVRRPWLGLPVAVRRMSWLMENMPSMGVRILARARALS